jgi:hypothetical protein
MGAIDRPMKTTSLKSRKIYRFEPFGPFRLPLEESCVIACDAMNEFWSAVDDEEPGLSRAVGCYIFSIATRGRELPWYVGKTERKYFRFETIQPHKLLHYQAALHKLRGKPLLYLIARINDSGSFRGSWKNGMLSVTKLEGMLIEAALKRNPELRNSHATKHLTQTVLPGFVGDRDKRRSDSASRLGSLLGT